MGKISSTYAVIILALIFVGCGNDSVAVDPNTAFSKSTNLSNNDLLALHDAIPSHDEELSAKFGKVDASSICTFDLTFSYCQSILITIDGSIELLNVNAQTLPLVRQYLSGLKLAVEYDTHSINSNQAIYNFMDVMTQFIGNDTAKFSISMILPAYAENIGMKLIDSQNHKLDALSDFVRDNSHANLIEN
jgi:hypothetical protein